MHQFVRKCCAILALAMLVVTASACGEDATQVGPECVEDADCDEDGEVCLVEDAKCVACYADEHCEVGALCVDNECEPPTPDCVTDDECPFPSQACVDEQCTFLPGDCSDVGDQCDPEGNPGDGFACEDVGRGYQCYEACRQPRACVGGQPGVRLECRASTQGCVTDDVDTPVCMPGECEDFFDTEEGCQTLLDESPKDLEDGRNCVSIGTDVLICVGAGEADEGEFCEETRDCGEGLTCVDALPQVGEYPEDVDVFPKIEDIPMPAPLGDDSFCARGCNSDDMCDDGESCIGADRGLTAEGVGICGEKCEAFAPDQCSQDTACIPVTGEDGICYRDTTRERDYFEDCEETSQCPDSAHCLEIELDPSDPDEFFPMTLSPRCVPLCDSTLPTQEERNATCPEPEDGELGSECVDLNDRPDMTGEGVLNPQVGSGVCLQGCVDGDDWGTDGCSTPGEACNRRGHPDYDIGWCVESGSAGLGQTCEGINDCADGLHCDKTGDGTGTCRSMCQPDEQTNDLLECATDEICIPLMEEDNLGECRIPCDPGDDRTDPNCPVGQQNCYNTVAGAYCSAAGAEGAVGDECDDARIQDCAPGLTCAVTESLISISGFIDGPFQETPTSDGQPVTTPRCVETCQPFTGDFGESGCPDGYACSPTTPDGPNPETGICYPETDLPISAWNPCPLSEAGKMCGDNAFCIAQRASSCGPITSLCLEVCNYNTGLGCAGNADCEEGFAGGPLMGFMGLCIPRDDRFD